MTTYVMRGPLTELNPLALWTRRSLSGEQNHGEERCRPGQVWLPLDRCQQ